jgi:hypothetical protein
MLFPLPKTYRDGEEVLHKAVMIVEADNTQANNKHYRSSDNGKIGRRPVRGYYMYGNHMGITCVLLFSVLKAS